MYFMYKNVHNKSYLNTDLLQQVKAKKNTKFIKSYKYQQYNMGASCFITIPYRGKGILTESTLSLTYRTSSSIIALQGSNIYVSQAIRIGPGSSYRLIQAKQRNSWSVLDWTSQIPLKVTFS